MEHWVKRNTHTKSPPPWADVCSTVHTHSKSDYHWSANRYKISQKPGHKPHQLVPGSWIISIKCTGNLDSPGLQGYQSSQDTSVCKAIVLSGTVHEILHLQQDVALFLSNLVIIMSLQWTANLHFTDFDASNESGYVVWFHLSHLSMWCYTIGVQHHVSCLSIYKKHKLKHMYKTVLNILLNATNSSVPEQNPACTPYSSCKLTS